MALGTLSLSGSMVLLASAPAGAQGVGIDCSSRVASGSHCFLGLLADGNGSGITVYGARANVSDFNPNVPDLGGGSSAWVAVENTSSTTTINQIGWAKENCDSSCPPGFVDNAPTYFYEWYGSKEGGPITLQPPQGIFAVPASELTPANGYGTSVTHLYEVAPNNVGWGFSIDNHQYFSVANSAAPGASYSPLDPNAAAYSAEIFTPSDYAPGATKFHFSFDNTEHMYNGGWFPDSLSSPGNLVNYDLPNGQITSSGSSSFQIWDARETEPCAL